MIKRVLEHNKEFVEKGKYKPLISTRFPNKKIAILTCMDTRLVELLPAAIGYGNGDVKIIKNAGGIISHPYGSVIRSLIIAIYKLGVQSVWVIGHTDCGMKQMSVSELMNIMEKRGIEKSVINKVTEEGVDFENWLGGFESAEDVVFETINIIKNHPLIPNDIEIEGLIIDSTTGKLEHIASE